MLQYCPMPDGAEASGGAVGVQLVTGLTPSSSWQMPASAAASLRAAFGAVTAPETLVPKINAANLRITLPDGRPLTAAIAQRDSLKAKHALLVAAIAGSRKEPERYSAREIKWLATMEVAKMQRQ